MKIKLLSHFNSIYPSLRQFRSAKESILERLTLCNGTMPELTEETLEEEESEIAASAGSMLCPQAHASFMGLRKLIEKDWFESEGFLHSTNILTSYKFSC
ncbi:hypothetical protein [Flavitalea sp.]|nr:hypothetical protein [Flavitalea sp.]